MHKGSIREFYPIGPQRVRMALPAGFAPKKVTCVKGVAVHDTTRYVELPIRTRKESYRVFRRVDDASGAAVSDPVVMLPRSCDGATR